MAVVVAVAAACCLGLLVATSRAAQRTVLGESAITSVVFHGNMGAPVIDIHGRGFGSRPVANPPRPPEPPFANRYLAGGAGCTTTTPPVGYDYGTSLYISTHNFSAGRYRPNLQPVHELDCVGIIILRYTPTRATFKLGSDYRAHHYQLAQGDPYQIAVRTLHFHGRVHYTA
jgi:hypothetical protein